MCFCYQTSGAGSKKSGKSGTARSGERNARCVVFAAPVLTSTRGSKRARRETDQEGKRLRGVSLSHVDRQFTMVARTGKKKEAKKVKAEDPLFPARRKSFRVGNDILPKDRDLGRYVRWPRK